MLTSKAKRWQVLSKKKDLKEEEILKILLINRGLKTKKEIDNFLAPPDPYEFTTRDLEIKKEALAKAIRRIKKAIKEKEKIIIYGDFDADGICATALLWETLYTLGAETLPFIPKREEGYGLKVDRLDQFKKEGVSLIITVDQGIVAYQQAKHAQKLGIDLIITDHHLPGKKKPKVSSMVHTTRISGAAIAWFLACQLCQNLKNKKALPSLDLVAIATVTDLMPLTGVNRVIVKRGLEKLQETQRLGLLKLYQSAGLDREKIGTYEIGFIIGPRINVSGRIDDPMEALRLLCTKDEGRATLLASKLDLQNRERRDLTDQAYVFARELWLAEGRQDTLIFLSHESFEEGIIGLVAGKLSEEFYRPAIVVSLKGEVARASARSIAEFDVIEAIRSSSDLLTSHGGHPLAAGFSVEKGKLGKLRKKLKSLASEKLADVDLSPVIKIDLEASFSSLNLELFDKLARFAPFGFGNPEPTFLTRNLIFQDARLVGADRKHLKLLVFDEKSGKALAAIAFGMGERFDNLSPEKKVDLVYTLSENVWNDKKNLELKVRDFRIKNGERT